MESALGDVVAYVRKEAALAPFHGDAVERYPAIAQALDAFLIDLRLQGRERTASTYGYLLRHLRRCEIPLRELNPCEIDGIVLAQRGRYADSSLRTLVYAMRSFFTWTTERGYTRRNPAERTAKPPARLPAHRWLSREQLAAMWHAARNDDDRLILLLAGAAGLRAGELLGLRFRDVDASSGTIRFRGKGKKWREVACSDEALAFIEARSGQPSDRVLARLQYRGLYDRVLRMGRRAGLPHVTPHQLRHSFAMHFLDRSGGDAFALQDLLGHEQAQTTGYYVRSWRQRNATRKQREVALERWLFCDQPEG